MRVPEEPAAAGDVLDAEVRVLDWIGLPLSDATTSVAVDGEPAVVERVAGTLRARLRMPELVPASGVVRVDIDAGSAHLERTVAVGPAAAARAELEVDSRGRTAVVRVVAVDRFGNRVSRSGFHVEAEGGRAGDGRETPAGWETELVADDDAWGALLRVVGESGSLAEKAVEFSPPTRAFRVGVVATGGVMTTGHGVVSPRGGLAAALRRGFGTFDLALQVGVDLSGHRGDSTVLLSGEAYDLSRAVTTVGVPVRFSGRRWLTSWFGLAAGLSVVPMYVRVSVTPEFQASEVAEDWVVALRADLRGFVPLGPGEGFAEVGISGAQLEHRIATGTLERLVVNVGYAFWVPGLGF
jgi:hypothetical protein